MSRLDRQYLTRRGHGSWRIAFQEAANALALPPATFKNLRDEFDPVHSNARQGWRNRPLRRSLERVLEELGNVSDDALVELVTSILGGDSELTLEAIDSLSTVNHIAHNVAERLLTGRRAEEYFLQNCEGLVGVPKNELVDLRNSAVGYDFGVTSRAQLAIEVKGLKGLKGNIQFTDREWREASVRRDNYWVVVIGSIEEEPQGDVIKNPQRNLTAFCRFQKTVCAVWRAQISIGLSR